VLYYLANRCGVVVATDLYEGGFVSLEAEPDFLRDQEQYARFAYRKEPLRVMRADGRCLPFEDATFDVVLSLSSVEHFGGHHAASGAMQEMARVLKPGGVVCVATEWIIEGGDHFEFFTPERFYECIVTESGLELIEPVDETPPPRQYTDDPVFADVDPYRLPHLVLGEGALRWTSVVAFLRHPQRPRQAAMRARAATER
jgi:SAM-dependent methyltransferase